MQELYEGGKFLTIPNATDSFIINFGTFPKYETNQKNPSILIFSLIF